MENENQKIVAVIGRPNVGKSTLFNRLCGKRVAIEAPIPGTTRDRLYGEVNWQGEEFTLIDVAGIESGTKKEIDQSIQDGVDVAIESADLILFIVDWNEPDNQKDKEVARRLKKSGKKVLLVVNKVDNVSRLESIDLFKRLGFQEPIPVSAISGKSSGDLLDVIAKELKDGESIPPKNHTNYDINLAIIGRPNVGKSTLLNTIIGEKRAVVSAEAGTTRDSVNVSFFHKGKNIQISDTAGIRRPGKVGHDTIESFSVIRAERALKNCDVAVLVIDASEGLVALDANILGNAKEWGKGIILAVNKIDLIPGEQEEYMAKTIWILQRKLNFAPWLPIVFISAQDEVNINSLLTQVVTVAENRNTLVPQEILDEIMELSQQSNPQLQDIQKLSQKRSTPPQFEITVSAKKIPHYTQVRYLENRIRDIIPMNGVPIYIDTHLLGRVREKKR